MCRAAATVERMTQPSEHAGATWLLYHIPSSY